jgi:nucleoside-diphosphate-sugar epimerase
MRSTRRDFLKTTAAVGGALGLGLNGCDRGEEETQPMRILILGGTGFIGPHQVRAARERGHTLTLFNRGRTNPELFPNIEQLRGDRDGDLVALEGRDWDVVLDNSGYVPRHVRDSSQLLKDHVDHYLFVSTMSVYADFSRPNLDEDAEVGTLDDPTVEQVTGETYGPLKALCEQAVQDAFGDRCTIVRPGLIVGPGDPTDRWTYWPVRVDRGGEVLAPGTPEDNVLIIDARDLTGWMLSMRERRQGGVYNAVGPAGDLGMGRMLNEIAAAVNSGATFTFVDERFLEEHSVSPWQDMPAWFPSTGEFAGFGSFSRARAVAQGLTFRPVGETARDTLEWFNGLEPERQAVLYPEEYPEQGRRPGLSVVRESEVLEAWHSRNA